MQSDAQDEIVTGLRDEVTTELIAMMRYDKVGVMRNTWSENILRLSCND